MNGQEVPLLGNVSSLQSWCLKLGIPIIAGLVGYLILDSVGNPYWEQVDSFQVGTNWCRTVQVMNPGPWTKRRPYLQFPISADVKFVSLSPGLTVQSNSTSWKIIPDDDLPPGIVYIVTYQINTREIDPKLMCDGKSCRNMRSSFDLDLILKVLGVGIAGLGLTAIVMLILYLNERDAHKRTVDGVVHKAIHTLLMRAQREEAEMDVQRAAGTVEKLPARISQVRSRPVSRKHGDPEI